jgi:hypothetical protein
MLAYDRLTPVFGYLQTVGERQHASVNLRNMVPIEVYQSCSFPHLILHYSSYFVTFDLLPINEDSSKGFADCGTTLVMLRNCGDLALAKVL